jgi:hypothetical protein
LEDSTIPSESDTSRSQEEVCDEFILWILPPQKKLTKEQRGNINLSLKLNERSIC